MLNYYNKPPIIMQTKCIELIHGTSRYDVLRREIDDKLTVLNSSWQDGLDKEAFYSGVSGDNYVFLYQYYPWFNAKGFLYRDYVTEI